MRVVRCDSKTYPAPLPLALRSAGRKKLACAAMWGVIQNSAATCSAPPDPSVEHETVALHALLMPWSKLEMPAPNETASPLPANPQGSFVMRLLPRCSHAAGGGPCATNTDESVPLISTT